jgi:short-subunit dehydrogenase
LAPQLRKQGISITAVCPGPVETEFFEVFANGRKAARGPMAGASAVVRKAYRDARRGKLISVYGFFFRWVVLMLRVLPLSFFVNRLFGAEWRSRERWLKKKRT